MTLPKLPLYLAVCSLCLPRYGQALDPCLRPPVGSVVGEPADIRSEHGVLKAELTEHSFLGANGSTLYCYTDNVGHSAPNLRVNPGDEVILMLKNGMSLPQSASGASKSANPLAIDRLGCDGIVMSPLAINLHFHGLTIPPVCHQDDVL